MYKLPAIYGKRTYDAWNHSAPSNLANTKVSPDVAARDVWPVSSFEELVRAVAFLGSMNKRLTLLYRGQRHEHEPLPMIFRQSWRCFDAGTTLPIDPRLRPLYWRELEKLGNEVYDVCRKTGTGLPRKRGLRDIRETQWAVIQHYELWPTPLIDLTSSLRVAATFAMSFTRGTRLQPQTGYVYVVAMPYTIGSIAYDSDQQLVLARLQSACPAIATRPHFQEGFLVGRFPLYGVSEDLVAKSSLVRRLVAKFKLLDDGDFWSEEFSPIPKAALLPENDELLRALQVRFGVYGKGSIHQRVKMLQDQLLAGAAG